jgi:hypothetical protein
MTKITLPFLYDYTFSNIVLPNALINELGIINYIHTLYSNRIRNNSFFEENFLNENSIDKLSKIFDCGLGNFPNSRGDKSHLQSGAYSHILQCTEESLYFGKNIYKKYIYPILISPHFSEFTAVNITQFPKLNGEYFWKHMSAAALEDAKNGRAIVLLDFGQENFVEKEDYHRLHECLRFSGIPKENLILAFNSFNSKQIYENWFTENQRMLEVHNWPVVVANSSYHFSQMIQRHDDSCVTDAEFINSRNVLREHKFLFKIRRPRMHRMALLFYMASENLLQEGDWSCLSPTQYRQDEINHVRSYYNLNFTDSVIESLYEKIPHHLKTETSSTFNSISAWNDTHTKPYTNTYFYICSETFAQVDGEYKSITEKVFKPMVNYLPFVFAAYPGALKLLQELGFKTFHPFIDETYDSEPDEKKRINMLAKEIKKICSMSLEELHNWYWNMESILQHNRIHATNWYKNDILSLNFIKYLHSRITS